MADFMHSFGVNKVERLKRTKYMFPIRNTCDQAQGALVPLAWHLVTPSELWSCKAHVFNRLLLTLAKPVYGDIYFSYTAHFVPLRILFKDYEKMFGDGSPSEWISWTEYVIPTITYDFDGPSRTTMSTATGYDALWKDSEGTSVNSSGHVISKPGNLANYCWLPPTRVTSGGSAQSKEINPAPMLAYLRIWSDFYRDENWQNEDPDLAKYKAFNSGTYGARTNLRFGLHCANRFHDYYSSLLPDTQKGPDVLAFSHLVTLPDLYNLDMENSLVSYDIKFGNASAQAFTGASKLGLNGAILTKLADSSSWSSGDKVKSTNLGVEISTDALRSAFALKRARERNARTGSRFVEAMLGTFEAHLPQAVAQKAEYLGGNSFRLNITSVPSTSVDHQGELGAFSATKDDSEVFRKTFNEPGIVMIVGTYRIKHRYAQGIPLAFMKTRRYHSYDPAFAHISEQPHYAWELNPLNDDGVDVVIGFNEPWVEDLKPVDHVCGLMGDVYNTNWNTYKQWTFVDEFSPGDSISPAVWLPENGDEVAKRCIDYNTSAKTWVFGTDFLAECSVVSPRPLYSIPGYIDHIIA